MIATAIAAASQPPRAVDVVEFEPAPASGDVGPGSGSAESAALSDGTATDCTPAGAGETSIRPGTVGDLENAARASHAVSTTTRVQERAAAMWIWSVVTPVTSWIRPYW